MVADKKLLLKESWDMASSLYTRELAPRFLPWVHEAVSRIKPIPVQGQGRNQHSCHHRRALIPCCGPGLEMPILNSYLGAGWEIIGIDLSSGMVAEANRIISEAEVLMGLSPAAKNNNELPDVSAGFHHGGTNSNQIMVEQSSISAVIGDAGELHGQYRGSALVVFSTFGLQQLGPSAPKALASWLDCLKPGGVAVVVLWTSSSEQEGPWAAYDRALKRMEEEGTRRSPYRLIKTSTTTASRNSFHIEEGIVTPSAGSSEGTLHPCVQDSSPPPSWEAQLATSGQAIPGIQLIEDKLVTHEIQWPDLETCWKVMTMGGPWHARRLSFGDAYMSELETLWRSELDKQPLCCQQPLVHHPSARMMVFKRQDLTPNPSSISLGKL